MSLTKLYGRGKWTVYTDETKTEETKYLVKALKGGRFGVFLNSGNIILAVRRTQRGAALSASRMNRGENVAFV